MRRLAMVLVVLAASPAMAAERPVPPDTAPRPCPRYGPGFVEVPGSTTCIRLRGRVTASAGASTNRMDRSQISGFGSSATVSAETRTETELGPFRGVMTLRTGTGERGLRY